MSNPEYELVELPTQFPVLQGNAFIGEDGVERRTSSASLVLQLADGTERALALHRDVEDRWWVRPGTGL